MSMQQTKAEKDAQLTRIEKMLREWEGFKTSVYWRMESERVRLVGEGAKAQPKARPCKMCEAVKAEGLGPSHNGSRSCRSGSIASGGDRAHCTCDACF